MFLHFLICMTNASYWRFMKCRHIWDNRRNGSRSVHVQLVSSVAKMSSRVHALAEKMFRKNQQISANFSSFEEVYLQKRIISKTGECVLKKNPQFSSYIATLICSKLWKFPVHSLIRRDSHFQLFHSLTRRDFFLFLWLFLMKGAVVLHSYIM